MKKIYLFLGVLLLAKESFALSLRQTMDVHIGIFDAATVSLDYQEKNGHFDINTVVKTANLFDTLYPFTAHYMSKGKMSDVTMVPELYETKTKSRNHTRNKKIFYNEKGIAYKRISGKDNKIKEFPIVGVSKTASAADLQSVFAELIHQFARKGQCNMVREIDDGKKHYNMISKSKGKQKRFFDYYNKEDTAELCVVYIENLADNNDNILWDISADRPIKLWVKHDEKTKMPIILEIGIDSTPLGALKTVPTSIETN